MNPTQKTHSPEFNYLATKGEPENTVLYNPNAVPTQKSSDVGFLADNELSRDIDMCVNTPESNIKVYIVIFDIDGSCVVSDKPAPFLKYAIEVGSEVSFPSIELACSEVESNDEYFKTETTLFLMQVLGAQGEPSDTTFYDQVFRGMVFNPAHKCVLAMFDYRKCVELVKSSATLVWAIVDELVFERKVWNMPVDVMVSDTLRQNPILWKLGGVFPFAEYTVKETNARPTGEGWSSTETGVFTTDVSPEKDAPTLFKYGDTIDAYKYGDTYGDMFIFVQKPLLDDGTGSYRKYARYAVFTEGADTKYILEDQYHHEYLEANSTQQNQTQTQNENEEAEEKEEAEEMPSVIYFVEDKITKSPTQMWGIRESSRFVRI